MGVCYRRVKERRVIGAQAVSFLLVCKCLEKALCQGAIRNTDVCFSSLVVASIIPPAETLLAASGLTPSFAVLWPQPSSSLNVIVILQNVSSKQLYCGVF